MAIEKHYFSVLILIASPHFNLAFGIISYEKNGINSMQAKLLDDLPRTSYETFFFQEDTFASFIKSLKRRSIHEDGSSLIHDLKSCQSSTCQLAFNGATYLAISQRGNQPSFVCNNRDIWSVSSSPSGCACRRRYRHSQPVPSLAVGVDGLHWLSDDGAALATLSTTSWRLVNVTFDDVINQTDILNSLCNIPTAIPTLPVVDGVNGSYISFNVSNISSLQSASPAPQCVGLKTVDDLVWTFLYSKNHTTGTECVGNSDCTEQVISMDGDLAVLPNLLANTSYQLRLSVGRTLGNMTYHSLSPLFEVSTTCGASSPVSQFNCLPQSFDRLLIKWSPPAMQNSVSIRYVVTTASSSVNITSDELVYESRTTTAQTYKVQAHTVGCPSARGTFSSTSLLCAPFHPPPRLSINKTTSTMISLFWQPPPPNQVSWITVMWSENKLEGEVWTESVPLPGTASRDIITDLEPYTVYEFRARIRYVSGIEVYTSTVPGIRTDRGPPPPPTDVQIIAATPESSLTWEPSASKVDNYSIEARNRSAPMSAHVLYGDWSVVEVVNSIGDQSWLIGGLTDQQWYEFRVFASNSQGRGDTSPNTPPHKYIAPVDNTRAVWIAVGSSIGGAVLLIIFVTAFGCWRCRIRRRRRKALRSLPTDITTVQLNYGMDVELARIRQMTRAAMAANGHEGFGNLPSDYRKRLKLFPRERLMLGPLLGSGAFGEVYQGTATDIKEGENGIRTRVAVKTLKETASENEKCEFLVEAYFMSLFDHPNIISLLGVCLDNEPQFLILELMEGGDLLKYLRGARPSVTEAYLSMVDLLDICLDLASGCLYLADKHFIHRDIAARNCLVSTELYRDEARVVKIGDFGLARDIYKNDYYYKEGNGMLPVRWMAIESLTLKRYTVQSDVWAFGVTMWEVLTFGQQPYPVYNNLEVIQFVKEGGRLQQPGGCPDVLYELMRDCWNTEPSQRPTFQKIYETLEHFKTRYSLADQFRSHAIRLPSGPVSYSTTIETSGQVFVDSEPSFFDNQTFVMDEDDVTTDHSTTDVTRGDLSDHVTSGRLHYLNHARSVSTTDSEHETVCKLPATTTLNYVMMGFPRSRETSAKSVVTPQSDTATPHHGDETKPLKPYTSDHPSSSSNHPSSSSNHPSSPGNEYVKTPFSSDVAARFPTKKSGIANSAASKKQQPNPGKPAPSRRKKRQRQVPSHPPLEGGHNDVQGELPSGADVTADDITRNNVTYV